MQDQPRPTLAIGPANYAQQATAWAQAVREHLPADAWSFMQAPARGSFQFTADRLIPPALFRKPVARGLRSRQLFRGVTHVALDGFEPYFHLRRRGKFAGDFRWLRAHGYRAALIAHGTDVRDPERHIEVNGEWSLFLAGSAEWREDLVRSTRLHRAIAEASGVPVFYSTPDLGLDLPFGTWLPVCLDVEAWASDQPVLQRPVPRVLHIPSKRNPPVKGTQFIAPVLEKLHDQGRIEFISPSGIPHAEVQRLVKDCDVVVDQLLAGSYGVATIEAMAAGRVVVGRIAPPVVALLPEQPPMGLCAPDQLESLIKDILDDRDAWAAKAAQGPAYTRRWHDGRASSEALRPFLGL